MHSAVIDITMFTSDFLYVVFFFFLPQQQNYKFIMFFSLL